MSGKIASRTVTFPIAYNTKMMGLAFSQSGAASSRVARIAIISITKTTLNLEDCENAALVNGAYYICIAY